MVGLIYTTKEALPLVGPPVWVMEIAELVQWISFTVAMVWLALGFVAVLIYPDIIKTHKTVSELVRK